MGKWRAFKNKGKGVWEWLSHFDTIGSITGWASAIWSFLVAFMIGLWSFFESLPAPTIFVLSFGVFLLILFLFKWYGTWINRKKVSASQNEKEPIQTLTPAPNTTTPIVQRDAWLLHVVHYIAFGSSEFVEIPLEEDQLTAGDQAENEIRQKAFDGSLPVWGIIGSGELFKPIPKEYWEHHYLQALIFAINDPEGYCTEGDGLESDHTIYKSLMTSKAKVEELWPVENT